MSGNLLIKSTSPTSRLLYICSDRDSLDLECCVQWPLTLHRPLSTAHRALVFIDMQALFTRQGQAK